MAEIRYFQFVNWEKWYPRKDYKSMPWVKISTKFYEDPKLDSLSPIQKGILLWSILETGKQNIGCGRVRIDRDYVAHFFLETELSFGTQIESRVGADREQIESRVGAGEKQAVSKLFNQLVRLGVIIEIDNPSRTSSVRDPYVPPPLRGKNKNNINPPYPPLEEASVRDLLDRALGGKNLPTGERG